MNKIYAKSYFSVNNFSMLYKIYIKVTILRTEKNSKKKKKLISLIM